MAGLFSKLFDLATAAKNVASRVFFRGKKPLVQPTISQAPEGASSLRNRKRFEPPSKKIPPHEIRTTPGPAAPGLIRPVDQRPKEPTKTQLELKKEKDKAAEEERKDKIRLQQEEQQLRIAERLGKLREDLRRQLDKTKREYEDRKRAREAKVKSVEREADKEEAVQTTKLGKYLYEAEWVGDFPSSNVHSFSWDRKLERLYIQFHDGSVYEYYECSEREAISLYNAVSKGTWIWDNLRIRGTKLGHRKGYTLMKEPIGGRKYMGDGSGKAFKETVVPHFQQVQRESGNEGDKPYAKIGKLALKEPIDNKGRRLKKPSKGSGGE